MPLPAQVVVWINDHIERCVVCRTDLAHLRLTSTELRKARHRNGRGSLDPTFADRVMDRVQREESLQSIAFRHRRNTAAALSAGCVLMAGLCVLSGFNPLRAEWFRQSHYHRSAPSAALPPAPPFAYHDPFLPNYYSSDGRQALNDLKSVIRPTDVRTRWRKVGRHMRLVQLYLSYRADGTAVETLETNGSSPLLSATETGEPAAYGSRLK